MTTTTTAPTSSSQHEEDDKNLPSHAWEDTTGDQTWENAVREDDEGNLILAGSRETPADLIRTRRHVLSRQDYNQKQRKVVRDMIRYLYIIIDGSSAMLQKDPALSNSQTRLQVVLNTLSEFTKEYFDQNPLSHLGIILVSSQQAEIVSSLSSNRKQHSIALQSIMNGSFQCGGDFSLQNGLETAGRSLGHQPNYGSREIVVVHGALHTCDPSNILHDTLPRLKNASIRVSVLALAAELHVCKRISEDTHGSLGVCLDRNYMRDWLVGGQCTPPPKHTQSSSSNYCDMVLMGFPTKTTDTTTPTLTHATQTTSLLSSSNYTCPQCQARNADLPTSCAVCQLKLVLSPHLARSFHHLFPVAAFMEVGLNENIRVNEDGDVEMKDASNSTTTPVVTSSTQTNSNTTTTTIDSTIVASSLDFDRCCYGCLKVIGVVLNNSSSSGGGEEILRFQCPSCRNVFCSDCDAYLHETLHNCPGCLLY